MILLFVLLIRLAVWATGLMIAMAVVMFVALFHVAKWLVIALVAVTVILVCWGQRAVIQRRLRRARDAAKVAEFEAKLKVMDLRDARRRGLA